MTTAGLNHRMWEALAACPEEWGNFEHVHDGTVLALEGRELIETDMKRAELPGGGLSRSYIRVARRTPAGSEALRLFQESARDLVGRMGAEA